MCESDSFNQAHVFIEYRALESKLEVLNSARARKLIRILHKCFTNIADISISEICYYTTNAGITEKRERYPNIPLSNVDPDDEDRANIFDKELKFIKKFQKVIEKICLKVKLNAEKVYSAFEILLKYYEPPNDDINLYPDSSDLQDFFLKDDHSKNLYYRNHSDSSFFGSWIRKNLCSYKRHFT